MVYVLKVYSIDFKILPKMQGMTITHYMETHLYTLLVGRPGHHGTWLCFPGISRSFIGASRREAHVVVYHSKGSHKIKVKD